MKGLGEVDLAPLFLIRNVGHVRTGLSECPFPFAFALAIAALLADLARGPHLAVKPGVPAASGEREGFLGAACL
eukprot:2775686-Heterocapsa_arctica.AAC.1